jgi:deoxyribonuclease V
MICAVDVHYRIAYAVTAGVLFHRWDDSSAFREITVPVLSIKKYEPGQFYKREMPCILELLEQLECLPDFIIIDGYVYLDKKPGLGKHLYNALKGHSVIIGVAKSRYKHTPAKAAVYRRGSKRALYVTAVGISEAEAHNCITKMHGEHRLPTLLKRVYQLSRETYIRI